MKRLLFSAIAVAGLGGCATYDQVSGGAAGGYYSGSPSYRYSYPGGYYGGYGGAYRYGYGGYGAGYGGYGYWPGFYGYYSRPSYVIHPPARRRDDHDGHDDHRHGHRPPPVAGGGNRGDRPATGGPRPWRPAEGHPRPPSMRDEHRARAQSPTRQRSPNGRPLPRAVEGEMPQSPMPAGSAGPAQSRPAPPSLPRKSHFRTRPIRHER
jgi:hypothetical protein